VHNADNGGDLPRLIAFMLNIEQVLKERVPGDFAELGVWRGNTAAVLAHYATAGGRKTILFDTFSGFDTRDLTGIDADQGMYFWDTSVALVEGVVGCVGSVEYVKGYFPDTISDGHCERRYAVVSLDCDLYAPMKAGLEFFYPRMSKGALFLLHDYSGGMPSPPEFRNSQTDGSLTAGTPTARWRDFQPRRGNSYGNHIRPATRSGIMAQTPHECGTSANSP
jgi:hypothetical protein